LQKETKQRISDLELILTFRTNYFEMGINLLNCQRVLA